METENNTAEKGEHTSNTKRIAKNTLMLYFRQILIMLVSLYTVRVVLNTLGAEDYGIYNVVAGVVTMFSFLSGAMATASQRFFSFAMGKGDTEGVKKTFSVTLTIYALLILIILIVAETVGLWFVVNKLVIPIERKTASLWIYQSAIVSFVFTMITTPYMASIIAHENMNVYAYVSIVEASLKLAIVFVLKVLPYDKLIVYGLLTLFVAVINTSLYRFYCKKHYEECKFKLLWDKEMFKEIWSFTGWSIFGAFTSMIRTQAITVLVNQFFNPIVVAARTIATQVANTLNVFSANFNTSLYAPIVKDYASDNKQTMYSLIFNGCKITFYLMWIFALPLILRMNYVLTLWLKNVPNYVVIFTILSVIEVLINSISLPIMTAARASGKVKLYELTLGSLQLIMFLASYIWIKVFDGTATSVFYTAIILNICMFLARLVIVKNLVGLSLKQFIKKVLVPVLVIILVSTFPTVLINSVLEENFISLCIISLFSFCVTSIMMFFCGISQEMREKIFLHIKLTLIKKR